VRRLLLEDGVQIVVSPANYFRLQSNNLDSYTSTCIREPEGVIFAVSNLCQFVIYFVTVRSCKSSHRAEHSS
jgi:hypothetical protein